MNLPVCICNFDLCRLTISNKSLPLNKTCMQIRRIRPGISSNFMMNLRSREEPGGLLTTKLRLSVLPVALWQEAKFSCTTYVLNRIAAMNTLHRACLNALPMTGKCMVPKHSRSKLIRIILQLKPCIVLWVPHVLQRVLTITQMAPMPIFFRFNYRSNIVVRITQATTNNQQKLRNRQRQFVLGRPFARHIHHKSVSALLLRAI